MTAFTQSCDDDPPPHGGAHVDSALERAIQCFAQTLEPENFRPNNPSRNGEIGTYRSVVISRDVVRHGAHAPSIEHEIAHFAWPTSAACRIDTRPPSPRIARRQCAKMSCSDQ